MAYEKRDYSGRVWGLKCRLYPNKTQQKRIDEVLDRVDSVYDRIIRWAIFRKKRDGRWPSQKDIEDAMRTTSKQDDIKFMRPDILPRVVKAACEAIRSAGADGTPRLRSEGTTSRRRTFTAAGRRGDRIEIVDSKHMRIPRVGVVKARITRDVDHIYNVTVSQEPDGKYYASLCMVENGWVEPSVNDGARRATLVVGLGTETLIELSDGTRWESPRAWERSRDKISAEAARLHALERGSEEYERQRERMARLHAHVANVRRDWIHKMTDEITRDYDVIEVPVGDIAGEIQKREHAGLITDAAWGEILRQLRYKAKWRGKRIIEVNAEFVEVDGRPVMRPVGKSDGFDKDWASR